MDSELYTIRCAACGHKYHLILAKGARVIGYRTTAVYGRDTAPYKSIKLLPLLCAPVWISQSD